MNNKGQSLVSFIIILPIILLICGALVEFSNVAYQKHRLTSVTKTIISSILLSDKSIDTNEKDDIIKMYDDNSITIDELLVEDNNYLKITANIKVNSFLGKIINKDYYDINVTIKGEVIDNKVVFKKG